MSASVAAVVAFAATGSAVQTGLIALEVTVGMALGAFAWKLATVPPATAWESRQALAA